MPIAPRIKGKAEKIAWNILGKPTIFTMKPTQHEKQVEKALMREQTQYVR